jgi:ArsR family metal-binding transcriptional regulator
MVLIPVPRPPRSAIDPNRPVNSLLKTQIMHLHNAERILPARYHTDVYINAIKTEGEASDYIRAVTEAIHAAHAEAAATRRRRIPKRKGVIEIAAVADERAEQKLPRKSGKNAAKTKKRKR